MVTFLQSMFISIWRFLVFDVLSQSMFFTFYVFSSRLFLLFEVLSQSTIYIFDLCPSQRFFYSMFCPIRSVFFDVYFRFVRRCFLPLALFTSTFFRWIYYQPDGYFFFGFVYCLWGIAVDFLKEHISLNIYTTGKSCEEIGNRLDCISSLIRR